MSEEMIEVKGRPTEGKDIRSAILQSKDVVEEKVTAWGLELTVRGLTGAQRDEWEASMVRVVGKNVHPNMRNARAKLVAMCVVDVNGKRVFADSDVTELGRKSGRELDRVYKVAQRLSGTTDEEIEELAKNFESGQPGDSHSG
jgi:hypothetical protein